ncbi:MAG: radical SAM protein [Desulfobacterales bacterium]|nr:radical SAM protein [Desulfobacterales bacterium]
MNQDPRFAGRTGPELLAAETGGWKKKWKDKLPVGLIFPSSYRVGMSNLGFQLVHDLLNRNPDIVAERIFFPDGNDQPRSVESNRSPADFPILFCSISFEQDYPNLLKLLAMAGIPPLAADRTGDGDDQGRPFAAGRPLVIGGGVACFMNPEPLAPFIDLFVLGEAEPVLGLLIEKLLRPLQGVGRLELLRQLALDLPGCYPPALYRIGYDRKGGFAGHIPEPGLDARIRRVTLDACPDKAGHSRILTPNAEFADLYMTELGRGCSRGCRFCAAGFVYRPPRLWPAGAIISALEQRPATANRVGLLGMEMARPEDLALIAENLLASGCALSFSSLRADVISPQLLELLAKSRLKSAAIAPDGGSERLRRVINKGITADEVLAAAESLVKAGIINLKLYFMIGLPTETEEDLEELVALCLAIKQRILGHGRARGRLSNMSLSVNSFIPKPWTPFQYHPFARVSVLKNKIKFLRKRLANEPNLTISAERPERTLLQAVLARGDRRVGRAMLHLPGGTCTWQQALKRERLLAAEYVYRTRDRDEPLPWEIVDQGIDRNYLWREYQRGLAGKTTPPCNPEKCRRCGVCHDQ